MHHFFILIFRDALDWLLAGSPTTKGSISEDVQKKLEDEVRARVLAVSSKKSGLRRSFLLKNCFCY